MPTSVSNPASFSSVRTAFNTEGYGISTSFYAYRQGGGIVPASSGFNVIGAGTGGDPLQLTQFNGFSVPSAVDISNKSSNAYGRAYDSGSASASIIHYFYSDKTYYIQPSASGLPDDSSYTTGDGGPQSNWLLGGSAADFSMKYTYTGNAPLVDIGGTLRAAGSYFPLTASGIVASINLGVNQFGVGTNGKASTVTISIARTADTSTVLDTAVLTMSVDATVSDSPYPA